MTDTAADAVDTEQQGDEGRGNGLEPKELALRVKDRFKGDHVTLASAGVAFFGFLALIPMIVAGVSIYGLVAEPSQVTSIVDRLGESVPREVADFISQQLTSVISASSSALSFGVFVGVAIALWTASSGVAHLIEAVNMAYCKSSDTRPFWKRRALAIAMTLGMLALIGTSGAVLALPEAFGSGALGLVWQLLSWVAVAALLGVALAVLYRAAPHRDPRWRWVSWGAAFTVIALVVVSLGFRYYVANFGSYNETYGSLSAVVVVLLWLYLAALVVVIGAEINAEIDEILAEGAAG